MKDVFAKLVFECNRLFGTSLGENASEQELLEAMAGQMPIAQAEGYESRLTNLTERLEAFEGLNLAELNQKVEGLSESLLGATSQLEAANETIIALEAKINETESALSGEINGIKAVASTPKVAGSPSVPFQAKGEKPNEVKVKLTDIQVEAVNPFPQFVN